jgi:hypothetical protein
MRDGTCILTRKGEKGDGDWILSIIKNGQLILEQLQQNLPTDTEVEVIIIVLNENQPIDFEQTRTQMQTAFKEAGIETREQILELIRDVKKELFQERHE